ncbi:hypothetical protein DVH05_028193 [Phytophthora capsici]|nr:hypothetical protein DVH05_028193 [Phytophthora capsici]
MVRNDVKRHCKYECRGIKKNYFMLFNIIKEKARSQHKYHLLAMEQKANSAPSRKPSQVEPKAKSGKTEQRVNGNQSFHKKPDTSSQPKPTGSTPPKTGCWHCQGSHWLRDCPTAMAEDKSRAVDKMKEVKDRSRMKVVRIIPHPGEVMVNKLIVLPCCADSGSDSTVIPRTAVDKLIALWGGIQVQVLPIPIDVTVARRINGNLP